MPSPSPGAMRRLNKAKKSALKTAKTGDTRKAAAEFGSDLRKSSETSGLVTAEIISKLMNAPDAKAFERVLANVKF